MRNNARVVLRCDDDFVVMDLIGIAVILHSTAREIVAIAIFAPMTDVSFFINDVMRAGEKIQLSDVQARRKGI